MTASLTGPVPPVSATTDERIVSLITLAFSADPIARWFYPDPHQYFTFFPPLVRAFAGKAFDHDATVYNDDFSGAALWLPPGVHPDEGPLSEIFEASVSQDLMAAAGEFSARQSEAHPHEPHWYLPMIGVDPTRQGEGIGSRLLATMLQRCDRERMPAYLEATSPGSRRLYERFGFVARDPIQAAGSPPMWPMWRDPR